MNYGQVPGIGKPISRLVQGTVMLNTDEMEPGFRLLDGVHAAGCNTYDTAHVYGAGECERTLGQWIQARGIREQVVILAKGAHYNADRQRVTPFDISSDLHDSLARLRTDYIDLYLLHRDDLSVPVGPIVEVLNAHKEAGRIHAFGGSNWTAARIQEANAYAEAHGLTPFVVSSPHFSLAEQIEAPWDNCISITGDANAGQRAWYEESGFPLFCWSSLAGGWFSGRLTRENRARHAEELYMRCYGNEANFKRLDRARELARERHLSIAQVALAYVLNQQSNVFALIAAYTPVEFADCTGALESALTPEEMEWLDLRRPAR